MNILLSCIGRRNYILEYIRAHLEPGDRLIGTSNSEWTVAFQDCDMAVVLPDIADPEYVPAMLDLCREQKVDALLSFFDPDIDVLSKHLDEFRAIDVQPIIPSAEVSDLCFDKYRTFQFLQEQGFDTAITFLDVAGAQQALKTKALQFPVIVKPRYGFASRNVFVAHNMHEMEVFFSYAAEEMIIQGMLGGRACDFDLFVDSAGQVISVVPWCKIASRAGEVDKAITSGDRRLVDLGVRLGEVMGKLGHIGPLDADLFVQEDKVYILEMNPRFGGGYPMSHLAGADFPGLIVKMLRGERLIPQLDDYQPGIILMKGCYIVGGRPQDFFDKVINLRSAGMRN